ncbi:hypothetical protein [Streptomyces sp. NPDC006971]|uniref:hypothetical protein n=1 Tax=Streptomyces sp. NPDC006971 TaxID=3154784 RepID=UPI0033E6ED11
MNTALPSASDTAPSPPECQNPLVVALVQQIGAVRPEDGLHAQGRAAGYLDVLGALLGTDRPSDAAFEIAATLDLAPATQLLAPNASSSTT